MKINFEGYNKEKRTINLQKTNLYSIGYAFFFAVLYFLPYQLLWKKNFFDIFLNKLLPKWWISLIIFIIGIVLHELIHGISWSFFTKNGFKSIKFGIIWKMLTPYCHCKEALPRNHYLIGVIMPFILLGLLPAVVGIAINNDYFLFFGFIFSVAALGDLLIINLLRKEAPNNLIEDHPSEIGYFVYTKIDENH